ncbi:MgtC/SapB family protein [Pseudomonas yangonensis]|jgi:putative Mg2+ transporter-C (MgtC) family protein|uniref:MgtC/SapB family protein n=1 Tax=Pseudomonas yangonensis TaxID=2579922 RepID=UPI00137951A0|nr:MgtC/SapB family protein [Pseudomonas yangonensis]
MDVLERILTTLVQEFSDLGQVEHITRATLRLVLAMLLGGLLGYEREVMGKAAGMRTHMLVCLGAAIFVMALEQDGAEADAMSRVIQGIAAGVGFLGAGTILKGQSISDVKGLTTAAGLWASAAIGVAVGLGREATAVLSTVIVLVVLHLMPLLVDPRVKFRPDDQDDDNSGDKP